MRVHPYTRARIRIHVVFLPSEKDKAPIAIQPAATDLMSFYTPHHKYRTTATSRWCTVAFTGFTVTFITATSALKETAHWSLGTLGCALCFLCFVLVVVHLSEEMALGEDMRERTDGERKGMSPKDHRMGR
jgi:hypothetical protein